MKTAISIPDPVFREAEQLAERLGKTRSQLYTEAMEEYVTRHNPDTVTDQLNAVVDSLQSPKDPFAAEASRRILKNVEW